MFVISDNALWMIMLTWRVAPALTAAAHSFTGYHGQERRDTELRATEKMVTDAEQYQQCSQPLIVCWSAFNDQRWCRLIRPAQLALSRDTTGKLALTLGSLVTTLMYARQAWNGLDTETRGSVDLN